VSELEFQSLNKGGGVVIAEQNRNVKDLIEIEWKVVDKLIQMAEDSHQNQRAFYYQTLASHIRILSMLLKLHGKPDDTQDLAKLLSEIRKRAKTLAKRLKQK
jgi:5-bromo-4-chloroindolyl phosphate hydrolysis protein